LALTCAVLVSGGVGCARQPVGSITVLADENEGFFERDVNGQPMGFEYDLLQAFAQAEQRQLEIKWIAEFDQVLPRLLESEGDVVASATITITPERCRIVDFSEPFMPTRVLVLSDLKHPYSELSDLEGTRVATLPGTTYEAIFRKLHEVTLVYVESDNEMFRAVAEGEADAFGCDSSVVAVELQKYQNLRIRFSASGVQHLAFAVQKGSRLKAPLDAFINEMKRTDELRSLLARHFGYLGLAVVDESEMAEG
jgi:ABC-type amino acid transport substrate-binding protein